MKEKLKNEALKIQEYRYEPGEDGKSIKQIKIELYVLKEFGFEKLTYVNRTVYKKQTPYFNYIIGDDRIIHFNHLTANYNYLDNTIYDLIQAGYIVRGSEE